MQIWTSRYVTIFPMLCGDIRVTPWYPTVVNVYAGIIVVFVVSKWYLTRNFRFCFTDQEIYGENVMSFST